MSKTRIFISFDYDHDSGLKDLLVGQSKNSDSPFEIIDMSIKEPISNNWKENARFRIKRCDVVIVICGEFTDSAKGVSAEVEIAKEESIPYFLICGYREKKCTQPLSAKHDKIYDWTWSNLKKLVGGSR